MILNSKDQHVYYGDDGSAEFLRCELKRYGAKRVFIVTGGKSFSLSGGATFLSRATRDFTTEYFALSSKLTTPMTVREVMNSIARFRPDILIGFGGGSVLDMSKLAGCFSDVGMGPDEWLVEGFPEKTFSSIPKLLVPTTAGSGSEATAFAVMYDGDKKYSVAHTSMLADSVLLNPHFAKSMNSYQKACSGFDALAQAIESYLAVGATSESRKFSLKSAELCFQNLEEAVFGEDIHQLEKMLIAAHWAGKAINISKTTAAHALSYILTSRYGLPHGHAVACWLATVLNYNNEVSEIDCNHDKGHEYVKRSIKDLCEIFCCESFDDLVCFILKLAENLGLGWDWVNTGGFSLNEVKASVVSQFNMERMLNNPRQLTGSSIEGLIDDMDRI